MGMNLFGPVIFIDDEEEVRLSGAQALEIEGFEVIPPSTITSVPVI